MTELIGQTIDRYKVVEQLGQGGMATVYKALDTRLGRSVAIKVIRKGAFPPDMLNKILQRFEQEAIQMARLNHPNIVGVIDYGSFQGTPYMVMPFIPSGTLKNQFTSPIPYFKAAQLLLPIVKALAYAHDEGIIHRDIKPSNILITRSGDPMLTDFGIAKILEEFGGHTLTSSGMGLGTVEYMAPEQWVGKSVPNSDQYALGVTFFELITGQKPFTADTPPEVMIKQATEPPPLPSQYIPDLPGGVENAIRKMLEKKPDNRYPNMHSLMSVFEYLAREMPEKIDAFGVGEPAEKTQIITGDSNENTIYEIDGQRTEIVAEDKELKNELMDHDQSDVDSQNEIDDVSITDILVGHESNVSNSDEEKPRNSFKSMPLFNKVGILGGFLLIVFLLLLYFALPADSFWIREKKSLYSTSSIIPKDGMEMVFVPSGSFWMGSNKNAADLDEQPVHEVYLDAFWIDRYEVSNDQYKACVEAGFCDLPYQTDLYNDPVYQTYPVVYVDWYQANSYCTWVGRFLPTEAQWEKAAVGTDQRIYPWGEGINCQYAQYDGCDGESLPVNQMLSGTSTYGTLHMAGNVAEWVSDIYDAEYYASKSSWINPTGPVLGDSRVIRGGSWNNDPIYLRSSSRIGLTKFYNNMFTGFRCAAKSSGK